MTIRGRAHETYKGKKIAVFTAADYITDFLNEETSDTIHKDGSFELVMQTDYTQPVFLRIDNVVSTLFVRPDFVYGITFPELDPDRNVNKDVDVPVNIGVIGADSTELNALIFDYEEQYNRIFSKAGDRHMNRSMMFKLCDSLKKFCDKRYAGIKDPFFKSYVDYSIAEINASLSRGEKFLMEMYLRNKPILYHHYKYMDFFKTYFNGYLARIASQRKGQSLYQIINVKSDYATLLNFVRYEKELKSDTLRELIILRELWDYNFSADFDPEAVTRVISQLNTQTKIREHKIISSNMLAYINKLRVGSPAPSFQAMGRDGKMADLSPFKGRWIYLNFFSTANPGSMKEMLKIAALKKNFAAKMVFVSICLDDSVSTCKSYLRANPKIDWPVYFDSGFTGFRTAKEAYAVTGTEAYYLIDNLGSLAGSPALSPSDGIEYRLNVIFKVRQKTTKDRDSLMSAVLHDKSIDPLQIAYEDNHIIVINKFPSEIVQGDKTGDMPLSEKVKNFIKERDQKPGNVFCGVIHRLDRPVSGLVIFAKTSKALSRFNELFRDKAIAKTYLAVVKNRPPQEKGKLVHYLLKNEKANLSRAYSKPVNDALRAELDYELLASSDRYHLLKINLHTGRHHQIRAQLSAISCPIKGDLKYGFPRSNEGGFIHLHSYSLQFEHPIKKEPVFISALPLSEDPIWKFFTGKLKSDGQE